MTRKEFFLKYYDITNMIFPDKPSFSKYTTQEEWQKGQIGGITKRGRKFCIILQYLLPALSWIPMLSDKNKWIYIPIALFLGALLSFITDFSLVKIEILYRVYRKNNVYASLLYEMFCRNFDSFLQKLQRLTKKNTMGYCFTFFRSNNLHQIYEGVYREKGKTLLLVFKPKCVVVKINGEKFIINDMTLTKDALLNKIASIINGAKV